MAKKKAAPKKAAPKKAAPKKAEEPKAETLSHEDLKGLAVEMNEIFKFEEGQAIDVKKLSRKELEEKIKFEATYKDESGKFLGLNKNDKFSDEHKQMFVKLGVAPKEWAKAEGKAGKKSSGVRTKKTPSDVKGKEWKEGSLCQMIYLTAAKAKKAVTVEDVMAILKGTEVGKKSGNLESMVKRILREAVGREILTVADGKFSKVA